MHCNLFNQYSSLSNHLGGQQVGQIEVQRILLQRWMHQVIQMSGEFVLYTDE